MQPVDEISRLTHDDIAHLTPGELACRYFDGELDHLIENLEVCDVNEEGVIMGVVYDPK